jgi:hypothetical protein
MSKMNEEGFIEVDYPRESWVLKKPLYKCQFKEGKCQLKHYPDNIPLGCIFKNDEWCKYLVAKETQEKLV